MASTSQRASDVMAVESTLHVTLDSSAVGSTLPTAPGVSSVECTYQRAPDKSAMGTTGMMNTATIWTVKLFHLADAIPTTTQQSMIDLALCSNIVALQPVVTTTVWQSSGQCLGPVPICPAITMGADLLYVPYS